MNQNVLYAVIVGLSLGSVGTLSSETVSFTAPVSGGLQIIGGLLAIGGGTILLRDALH